jgi:hypothetical protein
MSNPDCACGFTCPPPRILRPLLAFAPLRWVRWHYLHHCATTS